MKFDYFVNIYTTHGKQQFACVEESKHFYSELLIKASQSPGPLAIETADGHVHCYIASGESIRGFSFVKNTPSNPDEEGLRLRIMRAQAKHLESISQDEPWKE